MRNISILIGLLFICCEKEISIDVSEPPSSLVVNSLFSNDSVLRIRLGKTYGILESKETNNVSANIELYEEDKLIDTLQPNGDNFESDQIPVEGKNYEISIKLSDGSIITAQDYIPSTPQVISSVYRDSVFVGDEGDIFSQVSLEINDNDSDNNFYEVSLALKVIGNENDLPSYLSETDLFFEPINNDIVLLNEGLLSYFPNFLLFTDELFNEKIYNLNISFRPQNISFYGNNSNQNIGLVIEFRNVSENYYKYKRGLLQHVFNQDGDIWDGTGEPVQLFDNINNGYGIFAGYNQLTDTIYKSNQ